MDYIVRGTAAQGQIRAFASTTKGLVEIARAAHNTSPVATAALGRLLTGGAMMGQMMKGDKDLLTLLIRGDGPIGGITVTADSSGNVKGYVFNPNVLIHANARGKLDVGRAVGDGTLQVIKDLGLKEPYVGQVDIQTGEIADDLTYYFATSEQTPSIVGLGVLMQKDNTVRQAGGFIIQLMPDASDETIDTLEKKIYSVTSVTDLLEAGRTPEQILEMFLSDMELKLEGQIPVQFHCNCDKARVEKALISIGADELDDIIKDGESIEVNCHFCNTNYTFTIEELRELRERI